MAVKLNQAEAELIRDRRFMRRVAKGYDLQIAPGVWVHGAFTAQGQDRFIVDSAKLLDGFKKGLGALNTQESANFAAALLRLKTAGVEIDTAPLRLALADSPFALTLLAALDADVTAFGNVKWLEKAGEAKAVGTDAAFLMGSAKADRLVGASGRDTLAGNRGDDRLEGGAGGDTYLFGAGDGRDTITDSDSSPASAETTDTIRFGAGITPAKLVFRRDGQDLVLGFEGSTDQITIAGWGTGEANRIERFEFADGTVWDAEVLADHVRASAPAGTAGNDVLAGWDGVDEFFDGGDGDDVLTGASGRDYLVGGNGDDTLNGGRGNDYLVGGAGADTYLFKRDSGQDTIFNYSYGDAGVDTLRFGDGISAGDIVLSRESRGLVFAIAGTDDRVTVSRWGSDGASRIERVEFADGTVWETAEVQARIAALPFIATAGEGNDVVLGWTGFDETLHGFAGNDTVYGANGNDTLIGGTGDDALSGGEGSDVYVFGRGDGHDTITEYGQGPNQDTIRFGAGIGADDIAIARIGNGVVFSVAGGDDSITVENWAYGSRIERVEFADGSAWDADALRTRLQSLLILGTEGDDRLWGDNDANVLAGGRGNDVLIGNSGNDSYVFERGDGQDSIDEIGNHLDTIRFGAGIAAADIVLSRVGKDLVLAIAGTDDRVTVRGWIYGAFYRVEQVAFADGTVWDAPTFATMTAALPLLGTDGDDELNGDSEANTFDGGAGNDTLRGQDGADTYLFERGDGHDTIDEWSSMTGHTDVIRFGAGIAASDVILRRKAGGIVFEVGGEGSVTLQSWGSGASNCIERVEFADGTVWDEAELRQRVMALPVLGTDANDFLIGDEYANLLDGGKGDDTLQGRDGGDTYLFARGGGRDVIVENGFNQTDTLRFGAGIQAADIVLSYAGGDLVFGIASSDDSVTVRNWRYDFSSRIEQVVFDDGTVWDAAALSAMVSAIPLVGTEGDDFLAGDSGANLFAGGRGNDTLYGGGGSDTYLFARGDGRDVIEEGEGELDTIRFGEGIAAGDIVLSRNGYDLVFGMAGSDDSVTIRNWYYGASYRIEQVAFTDGTTWDAAALAAMVSAIPLRGTDMNDVLTGDAGANILDGGGGNDLLQGLDGGDTYLFERGDGRDVIEDYGNGLDTIRLGIGITAADLQLSRSGNSLVFSLAGTDDSITVRQWGNGGWYRIEQVVFHDGTVWDAALLAEKFAAAPLLGTDGDDQIYGDSAANVLDGGAGNDSLNGGGGGDTYLYERGDGDDRVFAWDADLAAVDTIRFGAGIAASDIALRRNDDDIVFEIAGGGSVTVQGWKAGQNNRIERVAFADGTVWDSAQLAARVEAIPIRGTDNDDVLIGDGEANTFDGGAGNDTLHGSEGGDTYLFERGDGQDTIVERGLGDADTIRFGAGIGPDDVTLARSGNDLVLCLSVSDDRITVRDWAFDAWSRIEQVAFADGTVWDSARLQALVSAIPILGTDGDDVLSGDSGANTFDGGAGNDTLQGGAGGDTYLFERGDGHDSIDEGGYDGIDTVRFGAGVRVEDVSLSRSGNDLVLSLAGSSDRITVRDWVSGNEHRIEQVAFADGTTWDAAALATMFSALPLVGTDGDDVLDGDDNANVLDAGAGNDTVRGGNGADTYLFERGDGQDSIVERGHELDTIRFGSGIAAGNIVLSRSGSDLVFALVGTDDKITVRDWMSSDWMRIEQVAFADGTVWDASTLLAMVQSLPLVGTDGDDFLGGSYGANIFDGGRGNDMLVGSFGDDTYLFKRGDGQDTIVEDGFEIDTIRFGADIGATDVAVSRQGADLVFALKGTNDQITVRNWGSDNWGRIDQVAFADGTVWDATTIAVRAARPIVGTAGDDVLTGDGDDQIFMGGAGNDTLQGEGGDDIYVFERGDGQDRIVDYGGFADTIRFAGITAGNIVLAREGGDLVLAVAGSDDKITVGYWRESERFRIEQVVFSDGTAWNAEEIAARVAALPFGGTDGDDTLYGDDGANVLNGGRGNDTLYGGSGSDTYLFERGDGQDTISENVNSTTDTLRFGAGISAADIVVTRDYNDVIFSVAGTQDQVRVRSWDSGSDYRIEQVEFADGTVWDAATLQTLVNQPIVGTDGDDTLMGYSDDNLFDGGTGNDILLGGSGSDTYLFELGDGQDRIGESGDDLDTIRFGAGIAAADILISHHGADLILAVAGTDDRVTVGNWSYDVSSRIEQVQFADGTVWDADTLNALANGPRIGTDGDDYMLGDNNDNVIVGGAGNDRLEGRDGADTYVFGRGDGQDIIDDGGFDTAFDTIRFAAGIAPDDIVLSRVGLDVIFTVANTDDRITVAGWAVGESLGIERVEFADGTTWDAEQLAGMLSNVPILGTDGDDNLYGNDHDNVLAGGAGNDGLDGGLGGDTYLFGRGDGHDRVLDVGSDPARPDVLRFGAGIQETDVIVNRYDTGLVFRLNGGTDTVEVLNWQYGEDNRIERVEFADGTVWDAATIEARIAPMQIVGGAGDDYLSGDQHANVFIGGTGEDVFEGREGDDVYVIESDDGKDVIFDTDYAEGNVDTLRFGAGIDADDVTVSRIEQHLVLTIGTTGQTVVVASVGEGSANAIERVEFADGTVWSQADLMERLAEQPVLGTEGGDVLYGWIDAGDKLQGAAGVDVLYGQSGADMLDGGADNDLLDGDVGDDLLVGGAGSDLLVGGAGNDTIELEDSDVVLFNRGGGQDIVRAGDGEATLSLGGGIGYADLLFSKSGNDLVLSAGSDERITFQDWYGEGGKHGIANLQVVNAADQIPGKDGGPESVAQFDFGGLVAKFDAARQADPGLGGWALSSSLLEFYLQGGNDAALGGQLSSGYGHVGDMSIFGAETVQALLASPEFGKTRQSV